MLWIHGQISPWPTIRDLVLPSLVCTAVPVAGMCASMPELQGPVTPAVASLQQSQPQQKPDSSHETAAAPDDTGQGAALLLAAASPAAAHVMGAAAATADMLEEGGLRLEASNRDVLVLAVGLGALLFVPVFKYLTGLPPYMGMLSGLAVLWMVTDALHFGENKQYPRVQDALRNVDIGAYVHHTGGGGHCAPGLLAASCLPCGVGSEPAAPGVQAGAESAPRCHVCVCVPSA